MKPPVETVRISKQGRDQLAKLRKHTGIQHWNTLCRWSLCASLQEPSKPQEVNQKLDGGIEMTWKVLAGEHSDIYAALVWARTGQDGYELTQDAAARCLRAHLHRGLTYLASGYETRSISDFSSRWANLDTSLILEHPFPVPT